MKKPLLFGFLLGIAACTAHAEIYTWVDSQGVVHYSDTPRSTRATPARLPGLQAADGNDNALRELQAQADRAAAAQPSAPTGNGHALILTSPRDEQTLRDAQQQVPVALTVGGQDTLPAGEQLIYYLDDQAVPQMPTTQTRLTLGSVARGAHTLSVALLYRGQEIKRTAPLTFYMQPPSAISPLNANQGGGSPTDRGVPGATVAPPAGNAEGATAAPRFNSRSAVAGRPAS